MKTTERIVRKIVAKNKLDVDHLLGTFLDESHYDTLIDFDVDIYAETDCEPALTINCDENTDCATCTRHNALDEAKIIAKFRKNWFNKVEQEQAYLGLRGAAGKSQNRGLAAGPRTSKLNGREWVTPYQFAILDYFAKPVTTLTGDDPIDDIKKKYSNSSADNDNRGMVWKTEYVAQDNFVFEDWVESTRKLSHDQQQIEAKRIEQYISETTYANEVFSGVAGWYDRYPRIPYLRSTSFTEENPEKFALAYPFLQTLNQAFKSMMPVRYKAQRAAADKLDPRYLVPETVFTTITVNKTFRTAAHYDAGDLNTGLSNLLVLSNTGNYTGGYLIAPQYRVAFDVRPGDLLLINNHEVMHGNTPIVLDSEKDERISVVCYFREGMLEGGEKDYEDLRRNFVDFRRLNPKHPLQKIRWNGISAGMWADKRDEGDYSESKEWYEYLKKSPNGDRYLSMYHPWLKEAFEGVKLEDFFA